VNQRGGGGGGGRAALNRGYKITQHCWRAPTNPNQTQAMRQPARVVHTAERIISLSERRHYHIQHAKITKRTSGGVPRTIIFQQQQQTSKSKRPHRV